MTIFRSRGGAGESVQVSDGAAAQRSQQSLKRLIDEAREAGRRAGLAEAAGQVAEAKALKAKVEAEVAARKRELEARLTPVFEALSASLADLENLEAQIIQASEADIVRLAIALAERVLQHQIDQDPQWMRDLLMQAQQRLPDRRQVRIRMHPQDAAPAREHLHTLGHVSNEGHLVIVDDAGLPRGGCILQSEGTTIDASLLGAVQRLGERLLQAAPKPDGFVAVGRAAEVEAKPSPDEPTAQADADPGEDA